MRFFTFVMLLFCAKRGDRDDSYEYGCQDVHKNKRDIYVHLAAGTFYLSLTTWSSRANLTAPPAN